MGPSYANLFVGYVEQQTFKQYTGPIPDFFARYIDDCLGTASCTRVDLENSLITLMVTIMLSNSHGKLAKPVRRSYIFRF